MQGTIFLRVKRPEKEVYQSPPFSFKVWDSSIGRAMVYGLDDRGFESRHWLRNFLFTIVSRPPLGPTQPSMQWVPRTCSLGIKWPGSEADHSLSSSAEIKNAYSYTSTAPIRLHGVVEAQGQLYLTYNAWRISWTPHICLYEGVSRSFRTESITK
jgi:hypothetical protein